jgi:quercetin 2,3-dioxygenase
MQILRAEQRQPLGHGPFQIRRTHVGLPGLNFFDHAQLGEGLRVPMHQHRNDEIISYLRSGHMVHQDSTGKPVTIHNQLLMVMNAGTGFSHEEAVPEGSVEMLQIFVEPERANLPPQLQFRHLDRAFSLNEWRLLVGPQAEASVRQQIQLQDVRLSEGTTLPVQAPAGYAQSLLYVFDGQAAVEGATLRKGDAVLLQAASAVTAETPHADLIVFHMA